MPRIDDPLGSAMDVTGSADQDLAAFVDEDADGTGKLKSKC